MQYLYILKVFEITQIPIYLLYDFVCVCIFILIYWFTYWEVCVDKVVRVIKIKMKNENIIVFIYTKISSMLEKTIPI